MIGIYLPFYHFPKKYLFVLRSEFKFSVQVGVNQEKIFYFGCGGKVLKMCLKIVLHVDKSREVKIT